MAKDIIGLLSETSTVTQFQGEPTSVVVKYMGWEKFAIFN